MSHIIPMVEHEGQEVEVEIRPHYSQEDLYIQADLQRQLQEQNIPGDKFSYFVTIKHTRQNLNKTINEIKFIVAK